MTEQTTTLDLRTVLDAVPRQGATIAAIAESLGVKSAALRPVLDHLLCGGLLFMRFPFRQPAQWVPSARARRMKDVDSDALAAWIRSRLYSAKSLPDGGAR